MPIVRLTTPAKIEISSKLTNCSKFCPYFGGYYCKLFQQHLTITGSTPRIIHRLPECLNSEIKNPDGTMKEE